MGRFKELVDTEEKMRNFRTKYNIPPHVGVRYAAQGEWYDERQTNEVVIPHVREYPRTIVTSGLLSEVFGELISHLE